jgi:C1A family cysteine protease
MNRRLLSLVLVALLVGSFCGSTIAITQTKVVNGATGTSAQVAPHFASLSPEFISYQQNLSAGNIKTGAGSGFVPPPINLTQLQGQSTRSALVGGTLPPSYDLRPNGVTSVKDQGSCGACWTFATYASLESTLKINGEMWDFSENNMKNSHGFDPAPCGGGNEWMAAAYLARWSGPVSESADPYNPSGTSSPNNLPIQKHVQDVYFIPDRVDSSDNDLIKTEVMTDGAVYTEMYFDTTSSLYSPNTYSYYDSQSVTPNHAAAIVGWDDAFSHTNFANQKLPDGSPLPDGAFIVKNSVGTSWGQQGYFYVSYYDANIGKYNAVFTAQPTTNYNNIYQYDPLGYTEAFGLGTATWGANVFISTANEKLTAVSFYTLNLNAPYEVYVYTDPVNGPINESGYAAHVTGTLALPGYHTIPLTTNVSLHAGQKFSVVVKFTSTDDTPVPTESPISGYSSKASAMAGESYYHADDSSWVTSSTWGDLTSNVDSANSNICIKAFTNTTSPMGGSVASAPAICAQDTNSLDLFAKGSDGALWWRHWDGETWSTSTSLGGVVTSDPTAVSTSAGKMDVFVRGADNALWWRNTTNGGSSWSAWSKIGGLLLNGTGPAAYEWGDAHVGVFVTGTNSALYRISFNGTWSSWQNLGGIVTSSPGATSPSSNVINVFVRGSDGVLWERNTTDAGTSWSTWFKIGGLLASSTGPASCAQDANSLDIFVHGTDGALWWKHYTSGSGWGAWQSLGGVLTSSPAAVSRSVGTIDVFVRGSDNKLWERFYDNGWDSWALIGGM